MPTNTAGQPVAEKALWGVGAGLEGWLGHWVARTVMSPEYRLHGVKSLT